MSRLIGALMIVVALALSFSTVGCGTKPANDGKKTTTGDKKDGKADGEKKNGEKKDGKVDGNAEKKGGDGQADKKDDKQTPPVPPVDDKKEKK